MREYSSIKNITVSMLKVMSYLTMTIIIIILGIACCNFFTINNAIKETTLQIQNVTDSIESIVDVTDVDKNISTLQTDCLLPLARKIQEQINQLKELKVGVFDSNTLTFLCSFLLVFLGGILFAIETRANKHIKSSEDIITKLNIEYQNMYVFNLLSILQFMADQLQFDFITNNNVIKNSTNVIIFEMSKRADVIISIIKKKDYTHITKILLDRDIDLITKILSVLSNEDVRVNSENKETKVPLNDLSVKIEEIKDTLNELFILKN